MGKRNFSQLSIYLLCFYLEIISSTNHFTGCGFPGKPMAGKVTPEKNEYEMQEEVTFECNFGYRLKGNNRSLCLGSHNWTGQMPQCQKNAAYKQEVKMSDINVLPAPLNNQISVTVDGFFTQCIPMGITHHSSWMVDLRKMYSIAIIHIVLEIERNYRFYFSVDIGERFDMSSNFHQCDVISQDNTTYLERDVYCNKMNNKAKIVRIQDLRDITSSKGCSIQVCEVEVYVESDQKECPIADRMPNCITNTENETVTYSPKRGFILTAGTKTRHCIEGNWNGTAPQCIRDSSMNDAHIDCSRASVAKRNEEDTSAMDWNIETCRQFNHNISCLIHLKRHYFIERFHFLGRFERNLTTKTTAQSSDTLTITVDDGLNRDECKKEKTLSDSLVVNFNESISCIVREGHNITIKIDFSQSFTLILCKISLLSNVAQNGSLLTYNEGKTSYVIMPLSTGSIVVIALTTSVMAVIVIGIIINNIRKRFDSSSVYTVDDSTKVNTKKVDSSRSSSQYNYLNIKQHIYEDISSQRSSVIYFNQELDDAGYLKPKPTLSVDGELQTECGKRINASTKKKTVSFFVSMNDAFPNKNTKKYKSTSDLSRESFLSIEDHIYEFVNSQNSLPKYDHQVYEEAVFIHTEDATSTANEVDNDEDQKTESRSEAIHKAD